MLTVEPLTVMPELDSTVPLPPVDLSVMLPLALRSNVLPASQLEASVLLTSIVLASSWIF